MFIINILKKKLIENKNYSKEELLKIIYSEINLFNNQLNLYIKIKLKENKNLNIIDIINEYKKKRNLIIK
jgi:hypothetical protein